MQDAFSKALEYVARQLKDHPDDWWVIGSAALLFHGVDGITANDIDILVPEEKLAISVIRALQAQETEKASHPLFSSQRFARTVHCGVEIEIMAGFALVDNGLPIPLVPLTRHSFDAQSGRLFAPSLDEMIDILRRFGRPKDLERIDLIRKWRKSTY